MAKTRISKSWDKNITVWVLMNGGMFYKTVLRRRHRKPRLSPSYRDTGTIYMKPFDIKVL